MRHVGVVVASGALLFAVVIMCQRTWALRWLAGPPETGRYVDSTHRWFEPILAAYISVAPLVLLVTVVALALVVFGRRRTGVLVAASVLVAIAIVLLAAFGLDPDWGSFAVGRGVWVLPALGVALGGLLLADLARPAGSAAASEDRLDRVPVGDRGGH